MPTLPNEGSGTPSAARAGPAARPSEHVVNTDAANETRRFTIKRLPLSSRRSCFAAPTEAPSQQHWPRSPDHRQPPVVTRRGGEVARATGGGSDALPAVV